MLKRSRDIRPSAEQDLRLWRDTQRCAFWRCCHPEDQLSFDLAQQHLVDYLVNRARHWGSS